MHDSVSVRSYSEVGFYFVRDGGGHFGLIGVSNCKGSGAPNRMMDGEARPILPETGPLESDW